MNPAEREARLLQIGTDLVKASTADETEVLFIEGRSFLTRFSRNHIHQSVGVEEIFAQVRVVTGKRIGVATSSSLQAQALRETCEAALAIARAGEPLPDWPGLPPPLKTKKLDAYDEATAEVSAEARADRVAEVVAAAQAKKGEAAGALETEESTLAVANSRGTAVAASHTRATMHTVVTCADGSGYAEDCSTRLSDLDARAVGRSATRKAHDSRKPQALPPGRYDVVLEPVAVAEWLEMLSYIAFSGKLFDEGQSPLSGRLGEKVTGDAVTIYDDALDRRTLPQPFDYEGVPRKRTVFIEGGVAKAVATNFYRAKRMGRHRSSGHALPASTSYECLPLHLFMKGGTQSERELVKGLKRGLLVTRFHYTNILDPMKTILTGMTRDGLFLVENGEVVGPVKNLRYTENVFDAFGRIEGLSKKLTLVKNPCLVPAARIAGVQFTGATEF